MSALQETPIVQIDEKIAMKKVESLCSMKIKCTGSVYNGKKMNPVYRTIMALHCIG